MTATRLWPKAGMWRARIVPDILSTRKKQYLEETK